MSSIAATASGRSAQGGVNENKQRKEIIVITPTHRDISE